MERSTTTRDKEGKAYFLSDDLLIRGADGRFWNKKDQTAHWFNDRLVALDHCIDRLADYEDIGYTPEEITALKTEHQISVSAGADAIKQLKAENERLRAEREKLEYAWEEMTYIIQKAAHRRCDYCVLRTEPCPARGLNAECSFEYAGLEESTCGK